MTAYKVISNLEVYIPPEAKEQLEENIISMMAHLIEEHGGSFNGNFGLEELKND